MDSKRRIFTAGLIATPLAGALGTVAGLFTRPAFAQKTYRFGFSQVTTSEPWRVQF